MFQLEPFIDRSTCKKQGQWEESKECSTTVADSPAIRHGNYKECKNMKQYILPHRNFKWDWN